MTARAVRCVGPGIGDVDHEHEVGPDRAAALRDDFDDRVVVSPGVHGGCKAR